jgi:site-specific recombinase XerD
MALAAVRSLDAPKALVAPGEVEDFEQELVDQYLLATVGAGSGDSTVVEDRGAIFEFIRFLGRPVWTAQPADADRFLVHQRKELHRARLTVQHKAWSLARFYSFLVARYSGDIERLTGHVVIQIIDEFNRPNRADYSNVRVPPSIDEIDVLFAAWREWLPEARKFLPATRDYMAASLWRRCGLRIQETYMLDIRDWRRDLGEFGKIHVRFGKGSRGRGPKSRLVPAINGAADLMDWWLGDIRHQFDDTYDDPNAPMFPSERRDKLTGSCSRIGDQALRDGLAAAVGRWLPAWSDGRLTPHTLRHFCASSLYQRGVDLKAIQELLGHEWLSTTTRYIHVHGDHIERAWTEANQRIADRLDPNRDNEQE